VIFTEHRFLFFFLVVFLIHWALPGQRTRKLWLLGASYAFYASWDFRFLSLILTSTIVDYLVGIGLARTQLPGRRKILLLVSIFVNLSILGVFKYFDFFVESASELLKFMGLTTEVPRLNLILPVGLSFYTFQTLSYSIDVYRRKLKPTYNFIDLSLFVAFFPQLVAGPIVRAIHFLPQLRSARRWTRVDVRACLVIFMVGFVQKAVLADHAAPIVDAYFAAPDSYSMVSGWVANFMFLLQVYCDFAGYSNMAIGAAGLLGYQLPVNFLFPYLAGNPASAWQRWHISLSSWISDYVYKPLRRPGQSRMANYRNLMLTFTLFGLWHGASFNFILWGATWGLATVGYMQWSRFRRLHTHWGPLPSWLAVTLFMAWIALSITFFRAPDFGTAWTVIKTLLFLTPAGDLPLEGFGGLLGVGGLSLSLLLLFLIHAANQRGIFRWWVRVPSQVFAAGYGAAVPMVFACTAINVEPFIYFQF